jgi:hypothetical protein
MPAYTPGKAAPFPPSKNAWVHHRFPHCSKTESRLLAIIYPIRAVDVTTVSTSGSWTLPNRKAGFDKKKVRQENELFASNPAAEEWYIKSRIAVF